MSTAMTCNMNFLYLLRIEWDYLTREGKNDRRNANRQMSMFEVYKWSSMQFNSSSFSLIQEFSFDNILQKPNSNSTFCHSLFFKVIYYWSSPQISHFSATWFGVDYYHIRYFYFYFVFCFWLHITQHTYLSSLNLIGINRNERVSDAYLKPLNFACLWSNYRIIFT